MRVSSRDCTRAHLSVSVLPPSRLCQPSNPCALACFWTSARSGPSDASSADILPLATALTLEVPHHSISPSKYLVLTLGRWQRLPPHIANPPPPLLFQSTATFSLIEAVACFSDMHLPTFLLMGQTHALDACSPRVRRSSLTCPASFRPFYNIVIYD